MCAPGSSKNKCRKSCFKTSINSLSQNYRIQAGFLHFWFQLYIPAYNQFLQRNWSRELQAAPCICSARPITSILKDHIPKSFYRKTREKLFCALLKPSEIWKQLKCGLLRARKIEAFHAPELATSFPSATSISCQQHWARCVTKGRYSTGQVSNSSSTKPYQGTASSRMLTTGHVLLSHENTMKSAEIWSSFQIWINSGASSEQKKIPSIAILIKKLLSENPACPAALLKIIHLPE